MSSDNLTVAKKIREAEMKKIPYVAVVGEKEESGNFVNVRKKGVKDNLEMKIVELVSQIKKEIEERVV